MGNPKISLIDAMFQLPTKQQHQQALCGFSFIGSFFLFSPFALHRVIYLYLFFFLSIISVYIELKIKLDGSSYSDQSKLS